MPSIQPVLGPRFTVIHCYMKLGKGLRETLLSYFSYFKIHKGIFCHCYLDLVGQRSMLVSSCDGFQAACSLQDVWDKEEP